MWSADEDENRAEVLTKLSSRTGTVRACDLVWPGRSAGG